MRLTVIATARVVGFHRWPDATGEYAYLAERHRHEWVIRCELAVSHTAREVEVNDLKRQVEAYLLGRYGNPCEFDGMSCEDIATELAGAFGLSCCEVLEDGFNGAKAETE